MNWRNFILLLLACCLFSSKAMAEPTQLLTISAQTERIALNEKLSFRVTHDNFSLARLGLDNPERWQSFNVIKSYQSGADKPMLWASVRLFNRSRMPRPFIIDLGSAYIDRASSYIVNDNGDIVDSNTVNFNDALLNRPYISDQLMLPVEVPANQTVWLVIAIKQWPEQLNRLTLWAPQALQLHQQQKQTALGVNAGVLLLLAVLN